ncbi:FtsX-like permease family protein [Streptomyces sp. NPDC002574]|uniref:FtsX-like permease family protein n=1 Tax=Streptomyces sp. NPDC002574 TaxID=3364652 RepID=UPI00369B639F
MTARFHGWRVAVRIARRDAWRAKGRSLMVLAMIAVPVVGVSAADVTIRSSQLTPQQTITRDIGAADARLEDAGQGPQAILQSPRGDTFAPARQNEPATDSADAGSAGTAPPAVDPRTAAPAGFRAVPDTASYAEVRTASGIMDTEVRELDAADPVAAGITDLTRGRFAASPDEVIATDAFLTRSGLHVGSEVRAHGLDRAYRIVGAYDLPSRLDTAQLDFRPGAFIDRYLAARKAAGSDMGEPRSSYLITVPGGFTWDMVQRANTGGVLVHSRAVALDPPADSEVPLYRLPSYVQPVPVTDHAGPAAAATVAGMALLEVCLLAGPAFAVGARRSRRQLGLVGANGGDRRHIRAIVLSGGLVTGAAAAVAGTVVGIALTLLLRTRLEEYTGSRFGGIALRPAELLGIAALAVVTGLLAAFVPAVTASRQSVLASLTGRRGTRRAGRALPSAGLVAVCLGALIAVQGSVRSGNAYVVAGGSAVAELGLVALTPLLVGGFGRLGRWLPLVPRLALRDAVRHRGRTAPAVAAVLAAVAGTVAVATYAASQEQQNRDAYVARAPRGVLAVGLPSDGGRGVAAVRQSVSRRIPVRLQADVSRLLAGTRICDVATVQAGCGNVMPVLPDANRCPLDAEGSTGTFTPAQVRSFAKDWRCRYDSVEPAIWTQGGILVGGPRVLEALGIHDPAARQALADGRTVLFDRAYDDHGSLVLRLTPDASKQASTDTTLPARLSTARSYGVTAVVPERAAASAGLRTVPLGSLFTTARMPSDAEQQALAQDIAKLGVKSDVYLEHGYTGRYGAVLAALTLFAGLVTIGAAGVATGLAQADAEADLMTLAAVGAPGRVRRTLSGFQCGVVAAMGVLLGTAAGILPAVALRGVDRQQQRQIAERALAQGHDGAFAQVDVPVVVPWPTIGMLLILVPLGATLLAALVTRSRTGMGRRAQD